MSRFLTLVVVIAIAAAGGWYFHKVKPDFDPVASVQAMLPGSKTTDTALAAGSGDSGSADAGSGGKHKKHHDDQSGSGQGGATADTAAAGAGGGSGQGSGQGSGKGGGRRGGGGPAAVKTVVAGKQALPLDAAAAGWAVASDQTNIAPQQAGLVVQVVAKDGQHVKTGDLIIKMDDRIAKAAIQKDQANLAADQAALNQAEQALQRATSLAKSNAGTQQVLDQAQATRDAAAAKIDADKATLEADKVTLANTELRAPFDGRLGAVNVSPGAVLSAGTNVVTVTKYDPIWVSFRLPQRYLSDLRRGLEKGSAVDVDPAATGGEAVSGKLRFYDNNVDQNSGTVLVKAEFANDKGLLWPGQSVNVTVRFTNDEQLVVVPTVAIRPGPTSSFVYTVDDKQKVHITNVEVARANGDLTAIASGLSGGEHVIVEGLAELTDGQTVIEQGAGGSNTSAKPSNEAAEAKPAAASTGASSQ